MKTIVLTIMLAITLALTGCAEQKTDAGTNAVSSAEQQKSSVQAPNITFSKLDGGKAQLADLRGKPVFLNFWATWCPPCVREMPHFEKAYPQYKDKINFIAISVDADFKDMQAFVQQKGFSFPIAFGDQQEIAAKYNLSSIPTSLLLDEEGNIIQMRLGAMSEEELNAFLQQAF